jgi:uncharacterized membrane protein
MSETVIGIFSNSEQAHDAVIELGRLGVASDRIGFITGDGTFQQAVETKGRDIITGVEAGAVAGGATGFLIGLTALSIPIAGPVIAAGTLAATFAGGGLGAAAGGLIGLFSGHGLDERHSEHAAKHVGEGGTIISVIVDPSDAVTVRETIERFSGSSKVDDIPDAGTIPSDPLHFSSDNLDLETNDDPVSELGSSRENGAQ